MPRQEYLFFRHAEPRNQDRAFAEAIVRDPAGRADYPLSDRGRRQASLAGGIAKAFGAELAISSSLKRSQETAEIIAARAGLGAPIAIAELDEVNPGTSSRLSLASRAEAAVSAALSMAYLFDRRVARHREGDSAPELLARIRRAFLQLAQMPAERLVVVGHGYWIFTACLLISPRSLRPRTIEHVASTRIVREEDGRLRVVEMARSAVRG